MPQQILIIEGGDSFDTYIEYLNYLKKREIDFNKHLKGVRFWKDFLQENLGDNYEVLFPQMPCAKNAKYLEWKIWFDKFIPFLKNNLILIGHSLGAIFLVKYLSENKLPLKIKCVFLIGAPFDEEDADYSLADFILPKSLEKFKKQSGKIYLYHSKDDPIVPFTNLEKYTKALPSAEKIIFKNKGHFILKEFPEFVEKLKSIK